MVSNVDGAAEGERVFEKLWPSIVDWFARRVGHEFHAEDMHQAMKLEYGHFEIAPESATRSMRKLKEKGKINYEVIDHRNSLYRVLPIPFAQETQLELKLKFPKRAERATAAKPIQPDFWSKLGKNKWPKT